MAGNAERRQRRRLEAAQGYLALDMPAQALRELRDLPHPEECAFELYRLRGEALRQQGEFDAALRAFDRALAEDETDLVVLMGMAWCYKRMGRLPCAIEIMERAYEAAPTEAIVLYNLSCYHALAGNKPQALSWLGRALRMEGGLRRLIPGESDFDRLRNDPDFQFVAGFTDEARAE